MIHTRHIGSRFGLLTIVGVFRKTKYWQFEAVCDCGSRTNPYVHHILKGLSNSCGCAPHKSNSKPRSDIKLDGESSLNYMWHTYKRNARKRGYVFLLSKDEFRTLIKKHCFYCHIKPSQTVKYHGKKNSVAIVVNGIDRFDNTQGYTAANSVTCCKTCNVAKATLSVEEFRTWVKRIARVFG